MSRWIVTLADGGAEEVEADSMYINPAANLWFSVIKAVPNQPEQAPAVVKPKKKPYVKKRPDTITVRAFNSHAWTDVRLIS